MTSALSPAQRAAITRAANKSAGISAGSVPGPAGGDRAAGLVLDLVIDCLPDRIDLSFRATSPDGKPMNHGLGKAETALPMLRWSAYPHYTARGELGGYAACNVSMLRAGQALLDLALPIMRRADRFIAQAQEQSDDLSFAFVASSLGSHFRANRILVRHEDGSETEHKRGAAYVTAHKAGEAFLTSHPAPEPEASPAE